MAQLEVVDMAWACTSRALDPGHETGDHALVVRLERGILLAVVDGLGHGAAAAAAAQSATAALELLAGPDVRRIIVKCHDRMRGTRGATMGIAWMDLATSVLTWLGIGNVAGMLYPARSHWAGPGLMPQYGGIVGRRISAGHPVRVRVGVGDTIVLATDGVNRGLASDPPHIAETEQRFADRMIATHTSGLDDALVLVARCTASHA